MSIPMAETYEYVVPETKKGRPIPMPDGDGHVWIIAAAYGVSQDLAERVAADPGNVPVALDGENLMTTTPIRCFKCEQQMSTDNVKEPCLVYTLNLHGPGCSCPK